MDLSLLFNEYRTAHYALMRNLSKIARKIITDYNQNKRQSDPKLQRIRFQISRWHPDQRLIDLDVQAWVDSDYHASGGTILDMQEFLERTLTKHLPSQKGFEIHSYFQNVQTDSEDD